MLHLAAYIGNIKVWNLAELIVALVPNIFRKNCIGIGCLVDILLNVFQERPTIFATSIRKHDLFLDLARDMVPLGSRVFVIGCQGGPVELFLDHFDDPDADRDGASDHGSCHSFYL